MAITARELANQLEVSERTIYRDMEALAGSGVAVEGEAGVGYRLRPGSHLPPLMFDNDEAMALVLGLRMVALLTDRDLGEAAQRAETRLRAAMSDDLKRGLDQLPYRFPRRKNGAERGDEAHPILRKAIMGQRKVGLLYEDAEEAVTQRTILPLAILGWGDRWSVLAWCELRSAYRNFRLDRMQKAISTDERFETGPDLSLAHYFQSTFDSKAPE